MYNKEILTRFNNYIISISSTINSNNIEDNIRYVLKNINTRCYDIVLIRKRRAEINQDIQDIYTSFVGGDSYDKPEQGKNTGMRLDSTDLKHIKIRQLKEELENLTNQTFLIEKSLEDNKKLISDVLDSILDTEASKIMKLFYLDCLPNRTIAIECQYSIDGIKHLKRRAITKIAKTMDEFKNQLKN